MQLALYILGVLTSVSQILADFERTCTTSDYFYGRRSYSQYAICGSRLADFIFERCGGRPFLSSSSRGGRKARSVKTDVFMDGQQANVLLRQKRSVRVGIVCECCIHQCSLVEINQYCTTSRTKRSAGGANSRNQQAAPTLEQIYREIDNTPDAPPVISQETFEKIQLLESIKRRNIAKKMLNSLTGQNLVLQQQTNENTGLKQSSTIDSDFKSLGQIIAGSLAVKGGNGHHT